MSADGQFIQVELPELSPFVVTKTSTPVRYTLKSPRTPASKSRHSTPRSAQKGCKTPSHKHAASPRMQFSVGKSSTRFSKAQAEVRLGARPLKLRLTSSSWQLQNKDKLIRKLEATIESYSGKLRTLRGDVCVAGTATLKLLANCIIDATTSVKALRRYIKHEEIAYRISGRAVRGSRRAHLRKAQDRPNVPRGPPSPSSSVWRP